MKELTFYCPCCNEHRLIEEVSEFVVRTRIVTSIDRDGNAEYGASDCTDGRIAKLQCATCGYTIIDGDGPITDMFTLREWLESPDSNPPKLQIFTWNTGRGYSEQGQKMAATRVDGDVYYVDVSRMLQGSFKYRRGDTNEYELKQAVMAAYDNNMGEADVPRHIREPLEEAAKAVLAKRPRID